jgi:hypothetical protein
MLIRTTAFLLLAIFNVGAQASILDSFTIESDLKKLAENPADTLAAEKLAARLLYKPGSAKKVFEVWSKFEDQPDHGAQWSEVGLNLLRWSDPERSYDWKTAVQLNAVPGIVYQQDSLVDLERTAYPKTTYRELPMHRGYGVADTASPERLAVKTSLRLVVEGQPAIGPDHKPILVCKLGRSSQAPYVEMSETQQLRFKRITGLAFSMCLSGKTEKDYWNIRYRDFVDESFWLTPNHKPGSSW